MSVRSFIMNCIVKSNSLSHLQHTCDNRSVLESPPVSSVQRRQRTTASTRVTTNIRNKSFSFLIWVKRRNIKFTWLHSSAINPALTTAASWMCHSIGLRRNEALAHRRLRAGHAQKKKLFFTLKDSQFSATLGCLKTHCKISFILLCHNIS